MGLPKIGKLGCRADMTTAETACFKLSSTQPVRTCNYISVVCNVLIIMNYNKVKSCQILWPTSSALSTNWMHNPHFWVIISYYSRLHLCVELFLKVKFVFLKELACQLACSINIDQLSDSITKWKKHQGNRNHSFFQFHSLSNLKLRFTRDPLD